uniref:MATH domain-containing protein n=1 Tax=Hordeum vulgare subsp. vulgare TaxID=112509 RepID=A0A8I6WGP3_HORVV
MGATASRSTAPLVRTTRIHGYSTLLRKRTFDTIVFRGLHWNVIVYPQRDGLNELGLADSFIISVEIDYASRNRLNIDISIGIEILDETGEHTVFQDDDLLPVPGSTLGRDYLMLFVSRRELEASSCVRDGCFTVRCTMTTKQAAEQRLSESKEITTLDAAMSGSHILVIGSFSKLKATLRDGGFVNSTRFAVGGCTWYLKLCPDNGDGFAFVFLLRACKADETPTTAEFSFELEGMVNFESHKMTHTFHPNIFQHFFRYRLEPLSSSSAMHDDRLLVRCRLTVVVPPATIPIQDAIPSTTSVLTPLLSAMYD